VTTDESTVPSADLPDPGAPESSDPTQLVWDEAGATHRGLWRSEAGVPAPKRVVVADDRITADQAYHLACEGTAMLWRGDFQGARQLLTAMARRIDRSKKVVDAKKITAEAFHLFRMGQAQRARTLGMVLIVLEADHTIALRRAPDVAAACTEVYGASAGPSVVPLRQLLGVIGAHEWRRRGVEIPVLGRGTRIYPHYGVFSPIRGEYLSLLAHAPLPQTSLAFDIGTGTGVIAAVLAKRGVERIVATDRDERALVCARDNLKRLGLAARVSVVDADLFPPDASVGAGLIVCNPPWLPGKPGSPLDHSIYDPDSRMLKGFLAGVARRLAPAGEAWLILSDFAEHLGLRKRDELLAWIADAGLLVIGRHDARPDHPKSVDATDPLHVARKAEVTSLWRLGAA
jgi:hypothetical protein